VARSAAWSRGTQDVLPPVVVTSGGSRNQPNPGVCHKKRICVEETNQLKKKAKQGGVTKGLKLLE